MEIIRLENVSKHYKLGDQDVPAVSNVSLSVERGVFLAIAGPSGSGKTTLLNMIGCIDFPTSGSLFIDGVDVSGQNADQLAGLRARGIGFIFQTFNLLPVLTAAENVEYPLLLIPEITPAQRAKRVADLLEVVGLTRFAAHRPNQLSGGQRQRVAIARALAANPKIVLADEPTANLDRANGASVLELMRNINRTMGTTFVFSTHDPKVIKMADHLVKVEDGRVVSLGVRREMKWLMVAVRPDEAVAATPQK